MSQETLFRAPALPDAASVWELVRSTGVLEPNSAYAYLLLCTHFAGTCLVAERDGRLVGFVGAYVPPSRPDAVFVWQIGVHPDAQGEGLGRRMLLALLDLPGCEHTQYLEATVGVSNQASDRLFRSVARALGTGCEIAPWFNPEHFPTPASGAAPQEAQRGEAQRGEAQRGEAQRGEAQPHEAEPLYRIGPLRR